MIALIEVYLSLGLFTTALAALGFSRRVDGKKPELWKWIANTLIWPYPLFMAVIIIMKEED